MSITPYCGRQKSGIESKEWPSNNLGLIKLPDLVKDKGDLAVKSPTRMS